MNKSRVLKALSTAALAVALTLPLAACGGSDAGVEGGYLIGFNTWGAGTPTFDIMGDETAYTIELYGGKSSRASDENIADKELQNIQNFIATGVDGIVMQCAADPVLPQAAEACKAAGIPFSLPTFVGLDEDRAEVSATNEYYAGSAAADLYMDGYLMGKAAIEDGHRIAVMLGGNMGDSNMERRIEGFTQAFVGEGGGVILNSARCTSPAESQEKANALLSAYQDADCVYVMAGDYGAGAVAAEDTLGIMLPIYASNANVDNVPYLKNGRIAAATGGNDLASNLAVALLYNYLDGHPILDENGCAPELKITPFLVNGDNADDFAQLFSGAGTHPLTEQVLKSLVWRYNEAVSYETFTSLIETGLTLEALLADHAPGA